MSTEVKRPKRPWHIQLAIHQLRVNVKSLAAEAKIIRAECRKARDDELAGYLHSHRVNRLRHESRLSHLALAYIRGMEYRRVEQKAKEHVSAVELFKKVQKFSWGSRREVELIEAWLK